MADEALKTAYRTWFPMLRENCRRLLRSSGDAEDVAQETFIRLWQSGPVEGDARDVTAWIYRISTRLAIDKLRAGRRHGERSAERQTAEDLASLTPDADDALASRQRLERLAAALPADEMEMALLSRVDGLTQHEIAEVTQVSDRTVRRALARLDARVARLRKEEI